MTDSKMSNYFRAISLTYKTAPISIREAVSFNEGEASNFLLKLKNVFQLKEVLLLSTCNRTELYYVSHLDLNEKLVSFLAAEKGKASSVLRHNFKYYNDQDAIRQLFRVALGLDSLVLGDIQIFNQVKRSYQLTADLELAGPFLHRLMHTIFYANKRVVQETRLQDGNASTASVAVDIIKTFITRFERARIALVGLGEIGQNVLDNLSGLENIDVTLLNRTRSRAEAIAGKYQYKVSDLDSLDLVIKENDVIISAVSAKRPIISTKFFDIKINHKLLLDLSVPRSIEKEVENIPGVSLINVDQLSEKTQKVKSIREKAIPEVELIIEASIKGFNEWKEEMEVSPTIQKLKNALDEIRRAEIAKHLNKASDTDIELLEVVTKNIVQKLIKVPVIQLKAACKRGDAEDLVDIIHDLFNLEKEEELKQK